MPELDAFQRDVIDRLGRIEQMLANDAKILYGNHQPGLVGRVAALELAVAEANARRSFLRDWLGWLMAGGIGIKEIVRFLIEKSSN